MNSKEVMLTPELAKEWLKTMPEYQRGASAGTVAEYAKDMADGRWVEGTGDVVRFNKRGQMIDGQHRCLAVVESGVSIKVSVIDGLDDKVYLVLDKGRKRTAADSVSGKNARVRATISKSLIGLNDGTPLGTILSGNASKKNHPISATEAADVANRNEGLISQFVECFFQLRTANGGRFSAAVATCLVAYALEINGCIETFYEFCSDLNKPIQERPLVCTMAREQSANFSISKGSSKYPKIFAIFAIAYKNWLNDTTPKVIQTSSITKDLSAVAVKRDWKL